MFFSENKPPSRCGSKGKQQTPKSYVYNVQVGSWTGRPLLSRQVMREESPNSAEQCADNVREVGVKAD